MRALVDESRQGGSGDAEHVGSLLRPRALVQARHDHAAGRIDAALTQMCEQLLANTVIESYRIEAA